MKLKRWGGRGSNAARAKLFSCGRKKKFFILLSLFHSSMVKVFAVRRVFLGARTGWLAKSGSSFFDFHASDRDTYFARLVPCWVIFSYFRPGKKNPVCTLWKWRSTFSNARTWLRKTSLGGKKMGLTRQFWGKMRVSERGSSFLRFHSAPGRKFYFCMEIGETQKLVFNFSPPRG